MTKLTNEQIQGILDGAPEGIELRHKNTDRNRALNTAVRKLSVIVNNHDPEVDVPIATGVWDCLDNVTAGIEKPLHKEILSLRQEVERLREQQDSKAITMLFGLMGYLTSMEEPITFSRYHNATTGSDILRRLMEANELKGNCDWDSYKSPKEQDHE